MHPSFERGFSNDFPRLISNFKLLLLYRIKFAREERISVGHQLLASWIRGLDLTRETISYAFDSLPKVRNCYKYQDKVFTLESKWITLIHSLSILFSPSVLILLWQIAKNTAKVVPKVMQVLKVR